MIWHTLFHSTIQALATYGGFMGSEVPETGKAQEPKHCTLCKGLLQPHEYNLGRHAWQCVKEA